MAASPIKKLSDDVLLEIFLFNARIGPAASEHATPLVTTRHASQVCRDWRLLMLSCGSLWGSIFNHSELLQRTDRWAQEIFRRSGTSPLWIRTIIMPSLPQQAFMYYLLERHWQRIQMLCLLFPGKIPSEDPIWKMIGRPTSCLQALSIFLPDDSNVAFPQVPQLLGCNAPSLRILNSPNVPISPWSVTSMHNLHSLDIFVPGAKPTEVLSALRQLSRLDNLTLSGLGCDHDQKASLSSSTALDFPSLERLHIKDGHLFTTADFLGRIRLPASCQVLVYCEGVGCPIVGMDVAQNIISTYLKRLFQNHAITHIDFYVEPSSTSFRARKADSDDSMMFVLVINGPVTLPLHVFKSFSQFFQGCDMQRVTDFYLQLCLLDSSAIKAYSGILSSLNSVKRLTLSCTTSLESVVLIDSGSSPILPALEEVDITFDRLGLPFVPHGPILSFLRRRRSANAPMRTLSVWSQYVGSVKDLNALRGMTGLRVTWGNKATGKTIELVCEPGPTDEAMKASNAAEAETTASRGLADSDSDSDDSSDYSSASSSESYAERRRQAVMNLLVGMMQQGVNLNDPNSRVYIGVS
ncbi:hypothetical protein CVT26_014215 [Gymnopilus dilepis]|uniref:F-box domain-containing protein n=1 Tax=Gymnopilus dilepis TaxID=231916 RepID=A0A409VXB7_9AGAR|nr:hypothetical protein CVT26_014215 [Gymnopilus dilepis]